MTDRELCEGIIKNGGCLYLDGMDCDPSEGIRGCPFYNEDILCDNKKSIVFATQWLKDHPESKYTYADVDLPEWWDGRPIKGYACDDNNSKIEVYCCGISSTAPLKYYCRQFGYCALHPVKHFEPLTETSITAKVSITKDGETKEIELTAEQIKNLGL